MGQPSCDLFHEAVLIPVRVTFGKEVDQHLAGRGPHAEPDVQTLLGRLGAEDRNDLGIRLLKPRSSPMYAQILPRSNTRRHTSDV